MNGAAVVEAAVEARNGRLYAMDRVLTPPSIEPLLPHRCDITENNTVKVRCFSVLQSSDLSALIRSIPGSARGVIVHKIRGSAGQNIQ